MLRKNKNGEDDFDIDKDAFYVSCRGKGKGPKIFNIFIYQPIVSAMQFLPAVEALQIAKENDLVVIHLSTPGGDVDATDTFLHAMAQTDAPVHIVATGGVHSAGTLIALAGDSIELSEGFNALVHNGSIGFGAKTSDFEVAAKYHLQHIRSMAARIYEGFLTERELKALMRGKDYWFTSDEFRERLDKRDAARVEVEAMLDKLAEEAQG